MVPIGQAAFSAERQKRKSAFGNDLLFSGWCPAFGKDRLLAMLQQHRIIVKTVLFHQCLVGV